MKTPTAPTKSKRAITFKLVVGTYDEVYHWYRSDQIDLAVMNPGPLALLLKEFGHDEMNKAFVGTRAIIPGSTSIAAEGGMLPRDKYNSILVVNRESLKSQFPSLYAKKTLLDHEALLHQLSRVAPALVCDPQSKTAVSNDRRGRSAVLPATDRDHLFRHHTTHLVCLVRNRREDGD